MFLARTQRPLRTSQCSICEHVFNLIAQQFTNGGSHITLFWTPSEDPDYTPGLSWIELLGEQVTQIKRACRRFCTTFDSIESYEAAHDKFLGKAYCCIEVNEAGKLIYLRNQDALDYSGLMPKEGHQS